jgi:hypothetical protein
MPCKDATERKQKAKQYYEAHKEQMRLQRQKYYELNKDKIDERNKRYYYNNREKINAQKRGVIKATIKHLPLSLEFDKHRRELARFAARRNIF